MPVPEIKPNYLNCSVEAWRREKRLNFVKPCLSSCLLIRIIDFSTSRALTGIGGIGLREHRVERHEGLVADILRMVFESCEVLFFYTFPVNIDALPVRTLPSSSPFKMVVSQKSGSFQKITVEKSASHHLSQVEIGGDKPCHLSVHFRPSSQCVLGLGGDEGLGYRGRRLSKNVYKFSRLLVLVTGLHHCDEAPVSCNRTTSDLV